MLTVAVLGPVEVRRDGVRLAVPAGKTTEVLIRLALDAGEPVRTERLIEDLWSAQTAGVARNTLQAKVSKLRRVLRDPHLVSGDSTGYTLHVDPGCVDALAVLRLADQRDRGSAATALAMFRGEILPAAGDGDWVAPHRARLGEVRLRLIEDRLAARIEGGAGGAAIGELEALVADHPLREGLWRLLITALYRDGRQGDALAAYRRVQQRLAGELGLDPGAELRELATRILRQDAGLDARPRAGNLPGLTASLIGRDSGLAALAPLLQGHRLVTVVGPAGVGKTRLAIEAARQAGGAWLVRLDGAAASWPVIGEALQISEATEAMVLDRLRGLNALLVLDNCEHLVDELPAMVGRLLDGTPGLRILATSQVPLGMDGESVYELEPLSLADSVALFVDRAAQQRRSVHVDTAAVLGVCRSLDGLPLAIELAAARTTALSVEEIGRRLGDRFTLLRDPGGRRPQRQRTLRAAIGWSYGLLFPDDQRGLWALARFAGGAPLPAAEHVLIALGVPAASAVDVIGRLVDRSLAGVDVDAAGAVRYRLLDSVRAYGLERLAESGLADVASGAHAAWFAARADRAAAGLRGPEQAEHLATVRLERANIEAALAWAAGHDPALGLRTVNGFGWAWVFLGAGADAAQRSRAALAAAGPDAPGTDRVDAMLFAGWFEASGGDLERAAAEIQAAIEVACGAPRARLFLAFVHSQGGRPREALAELADVRGRGSDWEQGAAWLLSAWAEITLGEIAAGQHACDEALRLLEPTGDAWALGHAEALLGALAQAEHRFPDAVAHLTRAADAAHRLGFAAAGSLHRANLGRAHQQNGDPDAAVAAFEQAIDTAGAAGDQRVVALARTRLARVLRVLGRLPQARAEVAAARRWYRVTGGGDGALLADYLAAALDDDEAALTDLLDTKPGPEIELLTLDALARIGAERGHAGAAAELLAAADALLPDAAHLVTDDDRIDRHYATSKPGPPG